METKVTNRSNCSYIIRRRKKIQNGIDQTKILVGLLRIKEIIAFDNCRNNFQRVIEHDLLIKIILYIEQQLRF